LGAGWGATCMGKSEVSQLEQNWVLSAKLAPHLAQIKMLTSAGLDPGNPIHKLHETVLWPPPAVKDFGQKNEEYARPT